MILYEYPCNERVRSLLRVEYLFGRLFYFCKDDPVEHHQIALSTLFDLLEITDRTDLRGAVLQDLERQRATLTSLRQHPGVDESRLDAMLDELQSAIADLGAQGRIAQVLRDNEWLASLRGRLAVPGGSSPADIPSFYAWQIKPASSRQNDLKTWITPFLPLYRGLVLILRLMRDSAEPAELLARKGAYQEMLTGKVYQLLRVWVAADLGVFPEVSANKYVIWVRFSQQDNDHKPLPISRDIHFRLARCTL